jgi:hypothetical protein
MHVHPAWKILNSLPLLGMQLVSAECCRKLLISLTVTLCADPVYKFAQIGAAATAQENNKMIKHKVVSHQLQQVLQLSSSSAGLINKFQNS